MNIFNSYWRHFVAFAGFIAVLSAFSQDIREIINILYIKNGASASIIRIDLSPNSIAYQDELRPIFGASEEWVRTIGPNPDIFSGVTGTITPQLVLTLTVLNEMEHDLVITDVLYNVQEIGEVMSDIGGAVLSIAHYTHDIPFEVGQHVRPLTPIFRVPGGVTSAFDIELFTFSPDVGPGWLLNIVLKTNAGDLIGETFQLYLTKKNMPNSENEHDASNEYDVSLDLENVGTPSYQLREFNYLPSNASVLCFYNAANFPLDREDMGPFDRDRMLMRATHRNLEEFVRLEMTDGSGRLYNDVYTDQELSRLHRIINTLEGCM